MPQSALNTQRINLLGGTYLARSLIANAQECLNLYPEKNPQDSSSPYTHQLTPGSLLKRIVPTAGAARGMYTATNGNLYYVCGNQVLYIDSTFVVHTLGNLADGLTTPVIMQDNGNALVIVNSQANVGWAINLEPNIAGMPLAFQLVDAGGSGTAGTYTNVPLSGGSGTGATASSITVAGGVITDMTLGSTGINYAIGDTLTTTAGSLVGVSIRVTGIGAAANAFAQINDPNFLGSVGVGIVDTYLGFNQPRTKNFYTSLSNVTYEQLTGTPGQPQIGSIINGGSGGVDGTYNNVALTGGSGTGATADITVSGGIVTVVALQPTGLGYEADDLLSANNVNIPATFSYELISVNQYAFDPTYIVGKAGYPDQLATIVAVHREWWLMGAYETTEVWYDAGTPNFPFAIMPGVFIQHGCIAPNSVQTHDLFTLWLGIDNAGLGTVFMGSGYAARRISTFAIEKMISSFLTSAGTISDALGMVYKQQDHIFYILSFPSADATIVYDVTEGLWHTRGWTDPNTGNLHRIRAGCCALAYNLNVFGDWQNGNIFVWDLNTFLDNGLPITRRRAMPHLLNNGKRVVYDRLLLDMDCGNGIPTAPMQQPLVLLEYSDDRGKTFTQAPYQSFGAQGQYLVQVQWSRLGMARDRVFRVSWSDGAFTALQGAWIDITPSET